MMDVSPDARCDTCGNTKAWHDINKPRHAFTLDGVKFEKPPPNVQESRWPFDPVLRQALIDKGVLTPQDLTDAEAKIRAVTAMMLGGINDGGTSAASGS